MTTTSRQSIQSVSLAMRIHGGRPAGLGDRHGRHRLEALRGDRAGQHSIRINNHFRLCLIWSDAGRGYWLRAQAAHDTEIASTQLAEEIEKIQLLVGC